jgi:hypothetical protein
VIVAMTSLDRTLRCFHEHRPSSVTALILSIIAWLTSLLSLMMRFASSNRSAAQASKEKSSFKNRDPEPVFVCSAACTTRFNFRFFTALARERDRHRMR